MAIYREETTTAQETATTAIAREETTTAQETATIAIDQEETTTAQETIGRNTGQTGLARVCHDQGQGANHILTDIIILPAQSMEDPDIISEAGVRYRHHLQDPYTTIPPHIARLSSRQFWASLSAHSWIMD